MNFSLDLKYCNNNTYIKINHPLRKGKKVYISNDEMWLYTSITTEIRQNLINNNNITNPELEAIFEKLNLLFMKIDSENELNIRSYKIKYYKLEFIVD